MIYIGKLFITRDGDAIHNCPSSSFEIRSVRVRQINGRYRFERLTAIIRKPVFE